MFVIVKEDVELYEWARPAEANAFGGQMQKVRLCVAGNPYKIDSVCQTTTEPMGLRLETKSPEDGTKVFFAACAGPDA